MRGRNRRRRGYRRRPRSARENPSTKSLLIFGGLGLAGAVALYFIFKAKNTANTPQLTTTTTTTTPSAYTPQKYHFSTNDSGTAVTLRPGDTVSFSFPNDPAAASTANKDWFWTSAPLLSYLGRTTQVVGGQLQETDTFTYGGGAATVMNVAAQFLSANSPALPTSGPTPPVAYPQTGASTFYFTINAAAA